jgi:Tfp pilus assembly protein PilN
MMVKKTSLGIDISAGKINLALLKRDKGEVKLLRAASGPLPEGVVVDGNIIEPVALAAAIKKLVSANKMRAKWITISLLARPALNQVIDLPKQVPSNIGQYVQNEVKRCAVLPVKNVIFDYCGIALSGRQGNNRLFVAAAENEKIDSIARALSKVGLDLDAVEPAAVASNRALYAKKVAEKFDSNILIAMTKDTEVTFCVFRKQMFDFIRCKNLGEPLQPSGSAFKRFVEEVNAIIQYYDIDVPDSPKRWEIVLVLDGTDSSGDDLGKSLRNVFGSINVQLSLPQTIHEDVALAGNGNAQDTSLAAIGLAMKQLETSNTGLRVNLLSQGAASIKSVKKLVLLTINAAVAILIIMILSVGLLNLKAEKVSGDIVSRQNKQPSSETMALMKTQEVISGKVDALSGKIKVINQLLQLNRVSDWDEILNDIRLSTPRSVCITRLINRGDSTIVLDGEALSYDGINMFGDLLAQSSFIESTSLVSTGINEFDGLITYSLSCSLVQEKGT